eukprot:jgi/Botrbrau1/17993/Bobra.0664s0002.1
MGTSRTILAKVYSKTVNLPDQVKKEWGIPMEADPESEEIQHIIQETTHAPRKPATALEASTEEIDDPPRWSGNHFRDRPSRYQNMSEKQKRAYIRKISAYQRKPENQHKINQHKINRSKYLYKLRLAQTRSPNKTGWP